jgi:hypothetical protein
VPIVVRHGVVILDCREVAGALDVTTNQVSNHPLIESAVASREDARVVDQVIDHPRPCLTSQWVVKLTKCIYVPGVPRRKGGFNDLRVLLRHDPRSIPQAPQSA